MPPRPSASPAPSARLSPEFHSRTDRNGVTISTNARPLNEYDPPAADLCPAEPRYRQGPDGRGYIEAPPTSLIERQRARMLNQLGSSQAMLSVGDVLPRTQRVDNGPPDPHAPGCYCGQCERARALIGTANTSAAPRPY
jgi:hypothetical protein